MPTSTPWKPSKLHAFTGRDLPWLLRQRAESRSDHPFIIWAPFDRPYVAITYAAFAEKVERLAGGLSAQGLRQGDAVLLHLENCPEFLIAWFACARIGALAVTTNTRSSSEEVAYFVSHSNARAAITQPSLLDTVEQAGADLAWIAVTRHDAGVAAGVEPTGKRRPFEGLFDDAIDAPTLAVDPLRPLSVQYTSGTTARPKGVVWTHANALFGARQNASRCRVTQDDVAHACLPLYHTNSLSYVVLSTLWAGASLVLQPRFSASRYWDCIVNHGVTWSTSIPFFLHALAKHPVPGNHKLRFWGLGASDIPMIEDGFGVRPLGWFGMTETVSLPLMADFEWRNRIMSMGRPTLDYDVRIVDDAGHDVAFGESGHLHLRGIPGISLFLEYLNDPQATAASFDADGWFITGDLATPFEDGDIRYDGRSKDMMRVGGENVAASEIERVIGSVAGVIETAVVGRPHELLDEVPVAFVVAAPGAPDVIQRIEAACTAALADFKRPREIRLVDDLPRVTLGKVDKKALRASLHSGASS